jgi:hypothetical protein
MVLVANVEVPDTVKDVNVPSDVSEDPITPLPSAVEESTFVPPIW